MFSNALWMVFLHVCLLNRGCTLMGVDVCLHCMLCVPPLPTPHPPNPPTPPPALSRMARVLSVTEPVVDSSQW